MRNLRNIGQIQSELCQAHRLHGRKSTQFRRLVVELRETEKFAEGKDFINFGKNYGKVVGVDTKDNDITEVVFDNGATVTFQWDVDHYNEI